ncbi:MAG: hypothetical protein M1147_09180 [Nitrospirae bacterium]|nr:hypothetical protein [Nitrospirota bacterium]MCL5978268.1 hypothetical protein [Nitrospirota bacterium]
MDTHRFAAYKKIIYTFSSKFFFQKMKEREWFGVKLFFMYKGIVLALIGLLLSANIGWVVMLFAIPFLIFDVKFPKEIQKCREDLLIQKWKQGDIEWDSMINYLSAQYGAELASEKMSFGKGVFLSSLGWLAIGALTSYVVAPDNELNWIITEKFILAWVLGKVLFEIKKVFFSTLKDDIELALKEAKKLEKKWRIGLTLNNA